MFCKFSVGRHRGDIFLVCSIRYHSVRGVHTLPQCLKYKTDQKGDVRKMEVFTMRLLDLMTSKKSDDQLHMVSDTEDA